MHQGSVERPADPPGAQVGGEGYDRLIAPARTKGRQSTPSGRTGTHRTGSEGTRLSHTDLDDRASVAAFLHERDERAFGALYDRHTPKLFGLALRLSSGDEDAAAEVVQEVWARALPRLAGFRWQASLSTWLCAFVVNVWREHARRSRGGVAWCDAIESTTAGRAERPGLGLDIARAVDGLPTGYRTVLVLFGVYGFSHDEIAGMLDISPGTSKSQLSRARSALRRALGA